MSGDQLRAALPELRGSASRFDGAATVVGEVLQLLATQVDSEGACWGHDEPGSAFSDGVGYAQSRQNAHAALQAMRQQLTAVAGKVRDTAELLDTEDRATAETIAAPAKGLF
ncbi:WXG100 family type VII secretion target [Rhodococcus sp. D2-41]|uniref:WXG100 family type VII secretion target n=1 Tax=Speluncibacter jeojiensis TaxID=2710754 RepID=A0A9X4LX86_9ACTN|nr:WXG100 family type VII secretion target [Rhodococcus sp. D2-41]MDG3011849.1 WXG100 family type VII secretion target [Rhodococcus sp. D2-41]MDG3013301.1 WXG100 family type VII secretion target [Corynebacteriales bacterium D3-21]